MKREGRQQQSTTSIIPSWSPNSGKMVNQFHHSSPPTGEFFSKVSSKPTNQAKLTGKVARVRYMAGHMVPVSRSKDKAKGVQKIRSCDVGNHRLLAWKVVNEGGRALNYAGVSVSAVLGHLDSKIDCYDEEEEEEEEEVVGREEEEEECVDDNRIVVEDHRSVGSGSVHWDGLLGVDCGVVVDGYEEGAVCDVIGIEIKDIDEIDDEDHQTEDDEDHQTEDNDEEDEDDRMSFCDVGFVMEEMDGDEDWCMVAEL